MNTWNTEKIPSNTTILSLIKDKDAYLPVKIKVINDEAYLCVPKEGVEILIPFPVQAIEYWIPMPEIPKKLFEIPEDLKRNKLDVLNMFESILMIDPK
jgi:hypothetical protein